MKFTRTRRFMSLAGLLLVVAGAGGAQLVPPTDMRFQPLRGNLQLLRGPGSNIVLSTGADGALLVDAEYATQRQRLLDALAAAGATPVKILVNTHWHEDHVGGNEPLAQQGARIIAQRNSALRMHGEQTESLYGKQQALPEIAWPRQTVRNSLRLAWNGDDIRLLHHGPAHTDGDLVVFFRRQNVLVTGDLFVAARDAIRRAIAAGRTEDEVVAMHPAPLELAPAGRGTDRWVRILYREYHR